jgi:outer membrane protein W
MKKMLSLAALASTLAFGTAHASDTGLYLGVAAGSTKYDIKSLNVDDSNGYKVTIGTNVSPNLGMELSYIDFGKADFRLLGQSGTVQLTGANVSVVGRLPINEAFSVHAKVGYFGGDATATGRAGTATDSGSDPSFGLGATYMFGKNVGVRLEWDRVGSNEPIDMASLGVVVKF